MERIIVPVDFSETSSAALRFATYLARTLNQDLTAIHVFDAMQSTLQTLSGKAREWERDRLNRRLREYTRQTVEPVLATFQGNTDTLPAIHTEVLEGDPAQTLVWQGTQEATGLVVMGGVGAGEGPHAPKIFGSVAQNFVKKGSCPVILIPKGYGFPKVERLAIAFETVADLRRMSGFTRRIIGALHPRVHLVHVQDEDWDAEDRMEEELIQLAIGPETPTRDFEYHPLPHGNVVEQLRRYTRQEQVGLLALGGRRRPFFKQLFHRDHLGRLVGDSEVPILVIPFEVED